MFTSVVLFCRHRGFGIQQRPVKPATVLGSFMRVGPWGISVYMSLLDELVISGSNERTCVLLPVTRWVSVEEIVTYKLKQRCICIYTRGTRRGRGYTNGRIEMSNQDPRKFESNLPVNRQHVTENSIPFGSLRRRIWRQVFRRLYWWCPVWTCAFRLVNGKRFDVCAFLEVCCTYWDLI